MGLKSNTTVKASYGTRLVWTVIIGLMLFGGMGCSDTVSSLTITTGSESFFTIGVAGYITFGVSGGGDYRWSIAYSQGLSTTAFSFTAADAEATLVYDGGATPSGSITVTVKDDTGAKGSKVIAVVGDNYISTLTFSQDTVEAKGEVVCEFILLYKTNSEPVPGSMVTFEITEGPATFIDAEGNELGDTTTGTSPTDSTGSALARIKAGDTNQDTNVIVRAVSDTGAMATGSFTVLGNDYVSTLTFSPDTVGAHGETLCVFNLIYERSSEPVSGSMVTFEIIEGPATFIDAMGNELGDTTTGTSPTDSSGNALARIRTQYTAETTYVIVTAVSDTGETATGSFTVKTGLSLIHFYPGLENPYQDSVYTVRYAYEGALPGEVSYIIPFSVEHTDGNGNPLAHTDILLDTYLPSDSILSVTLGESTALPATITTDDDGKSDFVLYVTVSTDTVAASGNIGGMVLTGTSIYDVRGSIAIVFNVQEQAAEKELEIFSTSFLLSGGQQVSFSAGGGVPQ